MFGCVFVFECTFVCSCVNKGLGPRARPALLRRCLRNSDLRDSSLELFQQPKVSHTSPHIGFYVLYLLLLSSVFNKLVFYQCQPCLFLEKFPALDFFLNKIRQR